jgi:hypothetical protein
MEFPECNKTALSKAAQEYFKRTVDPYIDYLKGANTSGKNIRLSKPAYDAISKSIKRVIKGEMTLDNCTYRGFKIIW